MGWVCFLALDLKKPLKTLELHAIVEEQHFKSSHMCNVLKLLRELISY